MVRVIAAAAALLALAGAAFYLRKVFFRQKRLRRALKATTSNLEHLQEAFQRFAPQTVVEEIIAQGVSIKGEIREVTVLFADLVGFTAMSENMPPETVVRILNGYFAAMTRAITDHRGHVSKFIGDGIMALFGAPEPNPWNALDAVQAALAMREEIVGYNKKLESEGHPLLRFGVGLHRGPVVAGVIGSAALMEYTVIGDVVNTASRVEGLTRKCGTDILITASVRDQLDTRFRIKTFEPLEVKGRTQKVEIYGVEGMGPV